ncbi:homeobox protein CDX-2 [Alligator mississippiensis]|uniref:homeobox protein CDX-2 n=1 Tax=Alligator mississippiensis TaxID=8496 RepID=UPI00287779F0|nr:homeobox protein CDX-2 [Alligator mississippiensis]
MYVSYLLDKDGPMYPGAARHAGGLNLAAQSFVGAPPQYPDYGGYHVSLDSAQPAGPAWPSPYGADWGSYGQAGPAASAVHGLGAGPPAAAMAYGAADFHPHHPAHPHPHAGPAPPCPPAGQPLGPGPPAADPLPLSPGAQRRSLCEWMRKPAQPAPGSQAKTRTKDKYRVVYTDHQRLELEKEFHYSRYITIRRKAELAATLGLSERQVKIWFQNRRAKERKINKKKLAQAQPGAHGGSEPLSPVSSLQGPATAVLGPAGVLAPPVSQ